ncbi:hypothetical protein MYAER_0516 [Microcystis aeruginosa NIES-2549]|uniref:Uncharacterized protein n=2 Tax=Microcystis aeruginosa TaxID=1126 RepID=A0A0F6U1J1_MICAE|nr:hypothetical protein MYAER_0516 [Microcystis aeruginosa NIES-2549]AOC51267.1 hypothetical protein amyaer_0518 [Microcystis aeruginosa NIES-2481]GCL57451.1 hypothetical protein NIES3807_06060 [Microcystis aeruginosa NIES-3807]
MTLQLTINYPENLPDFLQKTRDDRLPKTKTSYLTIEITAVTILR